MDKAIAFGLVAVIAAPWGKRTAHAWNEYFKGLICGISAVLAVYMIAQGE
ncbi:hypothetical protein [Microvirga lotononidis]|uniref:Uncharacterized protein n=1 Tax=Microvirga lotononidis TaxID=864069 RepID=I4YP09_9HYPH|nr:hypothetical protein [Microvirga lotononidis]EIM25701.1 hypothetical protein MicloDRAFT_00064280 [Microvirga lotononidis]WQO25637.1 hypothetical protein U0023_13015 [Microvirga lotononidis]